MSVNTLAPNRHEPGIPQDPWGDALADAPVDENGRIELSDEQVAERYRAIMDQFQEPDAEAQSPAEAPVGNLPRSDYINAHTPEEIVRQENANMLASFALARTLMDSHPELIQGLATATENMDTIALPAVRPDDYQRRHARPRGYQGRHRR